MHIIITVSDTSILKTLTPSFFYIFFLGHAGLFLCFRSTLTRTVGILMCVCDLFCMCMQWGGGGGGGGSCTWYSLI